MTILLITNMTILLITNMTILLITNTPLHLHTPQAIALPQQPTRATHIHRRHHLVSRHQPLPNPARAEELNRNRQ